MQSQTLSQLFTRNLARETTSYHGAVHACDDVAILNLNENHLSTHWVTFQDSGYLSIIIIVDLYNSGHWSCRESVICMP